jgi:hypothetical protein
MKALQISQNDLFLKTAFGQMNFRSNALNLFYIEICFKKLRVHHFLVGICMVPLVSISNLKILST